MMLALPSTGLLNTRPARDQDAERNSDEHREGDGGPDQPEVFGGEFQNFGVILQDELQDIHD